MSPVSSLGTFIYFGGIKLLKDDTVKINLGVIDRLLFSRWDHKLWPFKFKLFYTLFNPIIFGLIDSFSGNYYES